jgi:amino acid permease
MKSRWLVVKLSWSLDDELFWLTLQKCHILFDESIALLSYINNALHFFHRSHSCPLLSQVSIILFVLATIFLSILFKNLWEKTVFSYFISHKILITVLRWWLKTLRWLRGTLSIIIEDIKISQIKFHDFQIATQNKTCRMIYCHLCEN